MTSPLLRLIARALGLNPSYPGRPATTPVTTRRVVIGVDPARNGHPGTTVAVFETDDHHLHVEPAGGTRPGEPRTVDHRTPLRHGPPPQGWPEPDETQNVTPQGIQALTRELQTAAFAGLLPRPPQPPGPPPTPASAQEADDAGHVHVWALEDHNRRPGFRCECQVEKCDLPRCVRARDHEPPHHIANGN